jgi:transcriptional regulator with PAS, ATPase and Fis domain
LTWPPQIGLRARTGLVHPGCPIAEAERRLIPATFDELDGDWKRAAKTLGISLETRSNRLDVYEAVDPRR